MAAAEDKSGDNMISLGWKFLNKETFGNGMEFKLIQIDFSKKKPDFHTKKCNSH